MRQPGWEGRLGRTDTCIRTAESLSCAPETISTLLMGYIPQYKINSYERKTKR